jgi:hypothetical protein
VEPTPGLDEALVELLGDSRTGDLVADLLAAGRELRRRREDNTRFGRPVFAALREAGVEWREIEAATGIPKSSAQRWAEAPPST